MLWDTCWGAVNTVVYLMMVSRRVLKTYFKAPLDLLSKMVDSLLFTSNMVLVAVYSCVTSLWGQMVLSFVSVKHARLDIYSKSTTQASRKNIVWYERAVLLWRSIPLPKTAILAGIVSLCWLVIFVLVCAADARTYSTYGVLRRTLLVVSFWVCGVAMLLIGIILAAILFKMGSNSVARRMRIRILLLTVPAALTIVFRGCYFLIEQLVFIHHPINPSNVATLGILCENVPCLLLSVLMWPMPKFQKTIEVTPSQIAVRNGELYDPRYDAPTLSDTPQL